MRSDGAAAVIARPEPIEQDALQPLNTAVAPPGKPFVRGRPLSERGTHVDSFRVLPYGDGRVAVAWAGLKDVDEHVVGATTGNLTSLVQRREIARDGAANFVEVAVGGPDGETATVVWRTRRGVRVAALDGPRIGPSTRYGRTPLVGGGPRPGARFPAVATDARGRRAVIWQEGWGRSRRLYARTSGIPRTQNLGFIATRSEVRLVASGDATYLAVSQLGAVQLRQSVAGGRFGPPMTVTALGGAVVDTRLHAHPNGRLAVVFGTSDFATRGQRLLAARITP